MHGRARAAPRCRGRRAAGHADRPAPPPGRPTAPWAAAWRAFGARTPSTGLWRTTPSRPQPAVQAAPGRQHERDAARRQPLRVQLRHPAPHVMHLRLAQRHAIGERRPRPAREGIAVQRERARRQAALDAPGAARYGSMSASGTVQHLVAPSRQNAGSSRDSAGARDLADAREELGAHVGAVARRVGRGQHQQAEGAGRARRGAAGSSPASHRAGLFEPLAASKPELTPQYGARRLAAKCFTSSLTPCAKGSAANGRRRPRRATPPAGS